jgi:hypothetical protein
MYYVTKGQRAFLLLHFSCLDTLCEHLPIHACAKKKRFIGHQPKKKSQMNTAHRFDNERSIFFFFVRRLKLSIDNYELGVGRELSTLQGYYSHVTIN